jgi:hypothetical protein
MSSFAGVVLIFSVLVIVLDTVAAVVSLRTGLRYEAFGIGAFAVYGWCGYLLGGSAGPLLAASGTGIVALVDATLGWAIAWRLGPGRPVAPTPRRVVRGIALAVVAAAAIGLAFGLIGSSFGTT